MQLQATTPPDIDEDEPSKPHWGCEECGHQDFKLAMPAWPYKGQRKCPRCKSPGFHPVGL